MSDSFATINKASDENVLVVIGRPVRLHVRLTGVNYLALEYAAPAKDFDEISSSENLPRVDSLVEEIVSTVDNNQYHA